MKNIQLSNEELIDLIKILNIALDNYALFTDVDDNGYEIFNKNFNTNVHNIAKKIRQTTKE